MKIRAVQLMQAVGMSATFEAKDFEMELDLEHGVIYLTPKRPESFRFRKRIIPLGNIATIDGYTQEELKKMEPELAAVPDMEPDTEPVTEENVIPEVTPKVDVIKFEKDKTGNITETKSAFKRVSEAKAEVKPE